MKLIKTYLRYFDVGGMIITFLTLLIKTTYKSLCMDGHHKKHATV